MKKDIADKWIAALRDPTAKQCRGLLERPDGSQCCLGVLCRVLGYEPVLSDGKLNFDGYVTRLPPSAVKLSGMAHAFSETTPSRFDLMHYNDRGKNFPEIADIIEQHWEAL